MEYPHLFVTKPCNVSQLLHVSNILPFWTQFGREGATATRNFQGITSCKIAVILYILLCEIKFDVITPEFIVHYKSLLSSIIFDRILIDRSYNYFLIGTISPTGENSVLITDEFISGIISNCNILPVGLYDNVTRSMKHYFLIVKFSENDYHIISAYGGQDIYVELYESRIELTQLVEFVNNVNTRNIALVREFIRVYFLNRGTGDKIDKELNSYSNELQLFYFHNLVGQIQTFVSSFKYSAGGGFKKRIHRRRKSHTRRRTHRTRTRRRTTRRRRRRC
jgi:hypothetical protein